MNHNDHEDLKDDGRPTKKVKITTDYQGIEELIPIPFESRPIINAFDEEDEEDSQPTEEIRASDLYLDTINRAILDFDFEKVCSVSLPTSIYMGALFVENTSKEEVVNLTLTPIQYTKTTTFSFILRPLRYMYCQMDTRSQIHP